MTAPPHRRRVRALPEGDLDELEPHLGLWRFAWLWLTRGERPIFADEAPEPPPSELVPSRRRRGSKREPPPPDRAAWRKRAWSWLSRSAPAAQESRRRRIAKAPQATLGWRARAWSWLLRATPAAQEPKRRRVVKVTLGLRARAWTWLTRSIPAPAAEPKRRRVARAPAPPLDLRARAAAWLQRKPVIQAAEAPSISPEPKRRRTPIAVLRAYRKRAFTWLHRPREVPLEPEIIAPAAPPAAAAEAPPAPGKRTRRLKASPPPAPPPPDPVTLFRRRAFAWFDEGGASTPLLGVQHPGGDVARAHLRGVLEALVFASEHPLAAKELARLAKAELRLVKALIAELVLEYHGRGFRLEEVAGGYIFRTSPAFAPFVREQVAKKPVRMSRAQIETLAIVAYRQPITRPEVDDVRGVDSGAVLKSLLERDFVRILGKKDEPGRPILYGTTADFLEFFGLRTLSDLPTLREFTELNDESKRTYEREMGEEPPEEGPIEGGLMGGEGDIRKAPVEAPPPRPASDYEDADGEGVESLPKEDESLPKEDESLRKGVESLPKEDESLRKGVESLPKGLEFNEDGTEVEPDVEAEEDDEDDEEDDDDEDDDDEDDDEDDDDDEEDDDEEDDDEEDDE